jgi:hypothetical protein
MLSDPNEAELVAGNTYVNVHTDEFPNGEIRGQLLAVPLPVELIAFDALADGSTVRLTWATASEENNAGFEVEHRITGVNEAGWKTLAFIDGRGTTTEMQVYSHRVEGLMAGTHQFRLKQIDYDGQFAHSPQIEVTIEIPGTYELLSAYPNPFQTETALQLTVARDQHVQVTVYDVRGQQVGVLYNGLMTGKQPHMLMLNGAALPSGIYLIQVQGEFFNAVEEVTLLK